LPRIFLPTADFKENQISITGEKAHYLASVLRCQNGEALTIIDGEGNCLETFLIKCDRKEVVAKIIKKSPCNFESHLDIILVQGMLKGDKMDMVIQKTTELGVKEILPVITERSQIRETRKIGRWRKIAEEASRQSGRSIVPYVHEPVEFREFMSRVEADRYADSGTIKSEEVKGFLFWEEEGLSFNEAKERMPAFSCPPFAVSPGHLLIGPEGGFTKEEVDLAKGNKFLVLSLGRRTLRAETAAISAVTLMQFLFGDMG
jgi:16S rRNA (uracil1498-N3)-methyltransferase